MLELQHVQLKYLHTHISTKEETEEGTLEAPKA